MSLTVNLVFEPGDNDRNLFSHIEDAKTGEILNFGKWVGLEDDLRALQLRVVHTRNGEATGDDICPTCLRKLPPPRLNRPPSKP